MKRSVAIGVFMLLAIPIQPANADVIPPFNYGPCEIDVLATPYLGTNSVKSQAVVRCSEGVTGLTLTLCIEFNVIAAPGPGLACSTAGPHTDKRSLEDVSVSTDVCIPGYYTAFAEWSADEGYGERHTFTVALCR